MKMQRGETMTETIQDCENCRHYEPEGDGGIWGYCYVDEEQPKTLTSCKIGQLTENCKEKKDV